MNSLFFGHPLIVVLALGIGALLFLAGYWAGRAAVLEAPSPEVSASSPAFPLTVLPFVSLSPDAEEEVLVESLTRDLIAAFAEVRLQAAPYNAVLPFKQRVQDLRTVAEELGVQNVLEGSARRAGDRVRISAQLINARTDEHLWAERFEGGVEDLPAMREKIVQSVTRSLGRAQVASQGSVPRPW